MTDCYTVRDLTFSYPHAAAPSLADVSFSVQKGEFLTLCGPSGSGKSTLLRLLKTDLAPHGTKTGEILYMEKPLAAADRRTQAAQIGFVRQSPEDQIVTDKVWHELAFGLESLGYSTPEIRGKVAEMASFFGIQSWFYRSVSELSGGQKQVLNLAAVMTLDPQVLILDEPTSRLDPVAAGEFLAMVEKINRELGTTVILSEHRLEDVFPLSDRVLIMQCGKITAIGTPREVGLALKSHGSAMFNAMPTPLRVWSATNGDGEPPITVCEGRRWLANFAESHEILPVPAENPRACGDVAACVKDVWFRYEKSSEDVLKGLTLSLHKGELFTILGGNGTGKTTMLAVMAGIHKADRGKAELFGSVGFLPQNPQAMFVKSTVREDLMDASRDVSIEHIANLCRLQNLSDRHPFDLSGGEQQRAALAKVLLRSPQILLLDEPTKGFDAAFKQEFAAILRALLRDGVAILMVSHDVEFCAAYADRCGMIFGGRIVAEGPPREFFAGNRFYTTAANRMAREYLPTAITAEDIIFACGGDVPLPAAEKGAAEPPAPTIEPQEPQPQKKRPLPKRTVAAILMILLLIPITIYVGTHHFGGRKYYFTSLLILLETMLPFFLSFEGRKPRARELALLAVLCAIGVVGRAAFLMLPNFKPVLALVVIAGAGLGAESGFLVGAMTMLTSNVIFGQGPWTPWQMFAMGIIGFLAGLLARLVHPTRLRLCVFGVVSAIVIYGGIMNPAAALLWGQTVNMKIILAYYVSGFPMDLIHAAATVITLWIFGMPMLKKLDRIKLKYGLME